MAFVVIHSQLNTVSLNTCLSILTLNSISVRYVVNLSKRGDTYLNIFLFTLEKNRYTLKLVENHSHIISNFLHVDLTTLQEGTFIVSFVGECLKRKDISQIMHSSTLEISLTAVRFVKNHSHEKKL